MLHKIEDLEFFVWKRHAMQWKKNKGDLHQRVTLFISYKEGMIYAIIFPCK